MTAVPPISPGDIVAGLAIVALVWLTCRALWPTIPTTKENPDMSVRTIDRADAAKYEVRWRAASGQHRSRTFDDPEEAEAFDAAVHAWAAKRRADEAWEQISHPLRIVVVSDE